MSATTNFVLLVFFCGFSLISSWRPPPRGRPPPPRGPGDQFRQFHAHFRRPYRHGSDEYQRRYRAFKLNLELIAKLNRLRTHNDSAQYGVTKFSDLTAQEFKAKYLSGLHPLGPSASTPRPTGLLLGTQKPGTANKLNTAQISNSIHRQPTASTQGLPLKVDLRQKNILGPVRNQNSCGGCWAFSVVETVEAVAAMKTTVSTRLSVQEVIDCSQGYEGGLWGCKGGDTRLALKWLKDKQKPLVPETDYPLKDESEQCLLPNTTKVGVRVTDFTCEDLHLKETTIQEYLVKYGPLSVSVDATTWNNYMGGIIQYHCGEVGNNHAVVIVGYDKTGDIPYYIVKNSWGTDFGDNGYLYIMMGNNVCGIAHEVSTVKVAVPV